jgi:16S rRNA (cytosine1402-N4)-methyltransferase
VTGTYHVPVLAEAVRALAAGRRRIVDATVGGGGHTAAFVADGAEVLAIDRDPAAIDAARIRVGTARVRFCRGGFGDADVLAGVRAFQPDFALFDLGVSSHQIDTDARGFSFRPGVALDMRMDGLGPTAADLLNTLPETSLRDLFRAHADEPRAGRLARTVVERRGRQAFASSDDLVGAIRRALGPRTGPADFARLFQAVRIAVNDELGALGRALPAVRDALVPGGRLAVISYHSGEDRLVKTAFREWAAACRCPPAQPVCTCDARSHGTIVTRRPIRATPEEIAANPRARSARLRAFEVRDAA